MSTSQVHRGRASVRLERFLRGTFREFPWGVTIQDWDGHSYTLGGDQVHWRGLPLTIHIKTQAAGKDLMRLNGLRFLERFVECDVDLEGNLYFLPQISLYASLEIKKILAAYHLIRNRAFQSISRAKVNVKNHYDIPQETLDVYLDQRYLSYSCGMFEDPSHLVPAELIRVGNGQEDEFDSLEKAQWRKFKDAADYINPAPGERVIDIGCGYGGQLEIFLENYPESPVVGWTHSNNQVVRGHEMLARFDPDMWELNEGDYREDHRVFDHITSTGMVSHVGPPPGLVKYVREVRKRIKTGGRYLHHALMHPWNRIPHSAHIGPIFNRKYVWPGFYWYTYGDHARALEENGFEVIRSVNLSQHYGKTTAAWYERMMSQKDVMTRNLGEPTLRAWQVFLAAISEGFRMRKVHIFRVYCVAV